MIKKLVDEAGQHLIAFIFLLQAILMVSLVSLPTMAGSGQLLVVKETTIVTLIAAALLVPLMLPEPWLLVFSVGLRKVLSLPLHS